MIIAEIGWNHMGNIDRAKKMIISAKESGCEFAKFQVWSVKNLKNGDWDNDGRRQIYESAELSSEELSLLKDFCDEVGIKFLISIFSIKDVEKIESLNLKCIKIPSTEATNKELIEWAFNEKFEKIFISTGCCNKKDLDYLEKVIDKKRTIIMHCVSAYPCPAENINLPRMNYLKTKFPNVGYSGHFQGTSDAFAAIAIGAKAIEKHFTFDKSLPGRDNKFALSPEEIKAVCEFERDFQLMNKDCGIDFQSIEGDMKKNYVGRWDA